MELPADDTAVAQRSQRLLSVDALRGFDMFWIIGGNELALSILAWCSPAIQKTVSPQLAHAAWAGFHFRDLILPLFIFLVGMTTVFSLTKSLALHGKAAAYRRLIRRTALLFLLGIFYSGGLTSCWPDIRLLGVLQQIAVCYLFTGILVMHANWRGIAVAAAVLLVGYWALLSFVPVPGFDVISYEPGKNWSNYLDSRFLPGCKVGGAWDPQGILTTLSATTSCLLGALAAQFLRTPRFSDGRKIAGLMGMGLLCLLAGLALGMQCPIIKNIATPSFILVAGGYSLMLLGAFHAIIDVWKLQRWSIPLLWIGANAITLYMLRNMVDFDGLARRVVGGDVQRIAGASVGKFLCAAVSFGMMLTLSRFLYTRSIFLRV